MAATQQSVAALLQSLLAKGLEANEALPTVKALVEAKIFSLDELTSSNIPSSISSKTRKRIMKKEAKKGANKKRRKTNPIEIPSATSKPETIMINRSPVLTLWAAIVAKKVYQLSFTEALTLGSAFAAKTAKGKGTSLGIYEEDEKVDGADAPSFDREFLLMGQKLDANVTPVGIRAFGNGEEQDPQRTWTHLEKRFGDSLGFVVEEMEHAADQAGEGLDSLAYGFYMHIRPDIPHGTKGWGAHGVLHTSHLRDYQFPKLPPKTQDSDDG